MSIPEVHFRCSNLKLFCKQTEGPSSTDMGAGVMRELSKGENVGLPLSQLPRDGAEEQMEKGGLGTPQSSGHAKEKNI